MAGFGGAVKLTGESEYRKALKQISQDLREVDSELKLVASQYSKTDKSQEALSAQSEALTKKLEAQSKKLGVLNENYKNLSTQAENNRAKHAALRSELELQAAKLAKIESESGKASDAYKEQAEVVSKLNSDYLKSKQAIESQELALSKARSEINSTKTAINATTSEIKDLGKEMDEGADSAKDLGDEVEASGEKAEKAGNGGFTVFKGIISNLASSAINAAVNGLKQLGSAIINVGQQAITSYADYEQLTGGIETLFGTNGQTFEEYSQKMYDSIGNTSAYVAQAGAIAKKYADMEAANALVLDNSAQAYKTVGMSANEYLQTVTSFSAALTSSLGGDVLKAAELSDQALQDIADNANKMGTDLGSVQAAFLGFSKGQYQLLDNLKIGYGGTKTEMERLLADAQKITGVKYDINNLSDVYEAIHVIQTELGITGTTQKEAEKTITGSMNTMKAAWSNLLTGMADDNANFDELINNFIDSVLIVADNLIPRVQTVISGLGKLATKLIKELLPQLIEMIPPLLTESVPVLISGIEETLNALMTVIPQILPILFDGVFTLISDLCAWLSEEGNVSTLLSGLLSLVTQLTMKFAELLPVILPAVFQLIAELADFLTKPETFEQIVNATLFIVVKVIEALIASLPNILHILENLGYNIVSGFVKVGESLKQLFTILWNWIKSGVSSWWNNTKTILTNAKTKLLEGVNNIKEKIKTFVTNILNTIKELPQKVLSVGSAITEGVWNGIKSKMEWIKQKIQGLSSTITNAFKSALGIASPSKLMRDVVGKQIAAGIGVGFEQEMKNVTADMADALPKTFDLSSEVKTGDLSSTGGANYYSMVNAFKEALSEVNIELDDQKVGKFVKKTVSDAIYT